jgi:hypothetical protein
VAETYLRCVKLRFDQTNAVIELNGLKIAEDRSFAGGRPFFLPVQLVLMEGIRAFRGWAAIIGSTLHHTHARTFARPHVPPDCARYIFTTMLGLCAPAGPGVASEYRSLYPKVGG